MALEQAHMANWFHIWNHTRKAVKTNLLSYLYVTMQSKSSILHLSICTQVKIQVMTNDGCRFWHQDSVPFRLVSTLRGPCTEWVPPDFSKATLKQRQHDSKHARSMRLNDV